MYNSYQLISYLFKRNPDRPNNFKLSLSIFIWTRLGIVIKYFTTVKLTKYANFCKNVLHYQTFSCNL